MLGLRKGKERSIPVKILVTGGAGFIGSHIVDHYVDAGYDVTVIDNIWKEGSGRKENLNSNAQFYQIDITDNKALTDIFDKVKPEIVNHQAAQHSVTISTENPQLDAHINVIGLLNILTNCTRVGTKKIIFASSGATYGTSEKNPVNEKTIQYPESPYGITKLIAEHYLRYWQQAFGLNYTAFRYGNVFGPRQSPYGEAGVIAIFAKRFLDHQTVRIDWNGKQSKDYIFVKDIAHANVLALEHGDNDIFCLGSGQPVSVNEIYTLIEHLTGYTAEIVYAPKRLGDIYQTYFDIRKARDVLGWYPVTRFEDGVNITLDYFRTP